MIESLDTVTATHSFQVYQKKNFDSDAEHRGGVLHLVHTGVTVNPSATLSSCYAECGECEDIMQTAWSFFTAQCCGQEVQSHTLWIHNKYTTLASLYHIRCLFFSMRHWLFWGLHTGCSSLMHFKLLYFNRSSQKCCDPALNSQSNEWNVQRCLLTQIAHQPINWSQLSAFVQEDDLLSTKWASEWGRQGL